MEWAAAVRGSERASGGAAAATASTAVGRQSAMPRVAALDTPRPAARATRRSIWKLKCWVGPSSGHRERSSRRLPVSLRAKVRQALQLVPQIEFRRKAPVLECSLCVLAATHLRNGQ